MKTWTDRTGHANLRSFTDKNGNFWLEQNTAKKPKWAKFAREGHEVAWEFGPGGGYSGRMLIDGEIYTPSEATKKFLRSAQVTTAIRLAAYKQRYLLKGVGYQNSHSVVSPNSKVNTG
jgi:hypothetical protein